MESHPPLYGLSGTEWAKLVRDMVKCVPKIFTKTLKGFEDAHLSFIQYSLIEVINFP